VTTKRRDRDYRSELAKLRDRVAELHAERADVEKASVPLSEVEQRIDGYLDEQAEARAWFSLAAPRLTAPAGEGGWGPMPRLHEGDVMPMLARAMRAEVRNVLVAEVRRHLDAHGPGLGERERAVRLAELTAELRQVERAEEALVVEAEGLGLVLDRRPDADPAVVLELVDGPKAAA
jgi:hypothetical protein